MPLLGHDLEKLGSEVFHRGCCYLITRVTNAVYAPRSFRLTGGEGEDAVGRNEVHGFHSCAEGVRNRQAKYLLLQGGHTRE